MASLIFVRDRFVCVRGKYWSFVYFKEICLSLYRFKGVKWTPICKTHLTAHKRVKNLVFKRHLCSLAMNRFNSVNNGLFKRPLLKLLPLFFTLLTFEKRRIQCLNFHAKILLNGKYLLLSAKTPRIEETARTTSLKLANLHLIHVPFDRGMRDRGNLFRTRTTPGRSVLFICTQRTSSAKV